MNPNYRTLNNDIGMVQRTNNGWDLWFDNGDLVKAEDFHSLQVGIIIACLTSWNYMNRYGNPTYEVFGNRAYQLLKANKSSMVQYKIEQFFLECLKRMRRVYDVVSLTVSEVPYDPYKYHVEFEVISINNQLVDGSFIVTTDVSKSTSYIDCNVYMPYASDENDLVIDLWLKNEYGGGLEGEILYMYLQKGNGEYEFYDIVGRTDETGYLRVTYTPTESNENNVVYFDFHGNNTYNPSTSKRTGFKTELFEYHVEFTNEEIATYDYADLNLKVCRKSSYGDEWRVMNDIVVVINGDDGKTYTALTDGNGEATVRVKIDKTTTFYTTYGNDDANTTVSIIKQTPTLSFTSPTRYFINDSMVLSCNVKDEADENINGLEVKFFNGDVELGSAITDKDGVASLDVELDIGDWNIVAMSVDDGKYEVASASQKVIVLPLPTMISSIDELVTAFESLEEGDSLFILEGEYVLSKQYSLPSCTIMGENATIKQYGIIFDQDTHAPIDISGIIFDGNNVQNSSVLLEIDTLADVHIHNCTFTNKRSDWNGDNIYIHRSSEDYNVEINNCTFTGDNYCAGFGHTKASVCYDGSSAYNISIHHNIFNHNENVGDNRNLHNGRAIAFYYGLYDTTLHNCIAYCNTYIGSEDTNYGISESECND